MSEQGIKECFGRALAGLAALAIALGPAAVSAQSTDGKSADKSAEEASKDGEGKEEKDEPKIDARAELDRANSLAGRGAWTRSIPHYEKVLKAAPERYPSAHYNLASVLAGKKEWSRALLHYQAYKLMGSDPATTKDAEKGVAKVKANVWNKKFATLSVDIEPEAKSTIAINGFVVAKGKDIEEMTLIAGDYDVRADVVDHHPVEESVTLENEGSKSLTLEPKKKTFFGKAKVTVNLDGATVKFIPKELKSPEGPDEPVVKESPVEKPVELVTGKWLLQVTKPDHHKWVRYIHIRRDETSSVRVELEEKLPEEIR